MAGDVETFTPDNDKELQTLLDKQDGGEPLSDEEKMRAEELIRKSMAGVLGIQGE